MQSQSIATIRHTSNCFLNQQLMQNGPKRCFNTKLWNRGQLVNCHHKRFNTTSSHAVARSSSFECLHEHFCTLLGMRFVEVSLKNCLKTKNVLKMNFAEWRKKIWFKFAALPMEFGCSTFFTWSKSMKIFKLSQTYDLFLFFSGQSHLV